MATSGLSSGTEFLRNAAKAFFEDLFQSPTINIGQPVDSMLDWIPSMHFKINDHLTIIAEVSAETPYPLIFSLRRLDILKLQIPISIYCICPEEEYLSKQTSAKKLMSDGFGLLTVSADGNVQRRSSCIPLVQQITDEDFKTEIVGLPQVIRRRLAEAFERYKSNAPSGVADISEVIEGLVLKAGREAAKKGWIRAADARSGIPAATLTALSLSSQGRNATAAIGAIQGYISFYRNPAHHFPKNKKLAFRKYRDTRHAFLDGLKKVQQFRDAMKNIGLSGAL
jgi:hypothetical protein